MRQGWQEGTQLTCLIWNWKSGIEKWNWISAPLWGSHQSWIWWWQRRQEQRASYHGGGWQWSIRLWCLLSKNMPLPFSPVTNLKQGNGIHLPSHFSFIHPEVNTLKVSPAYCFFIFKNGLSKCIYLKDLYTTFSLLSNAEIKIQAQSDDKTRHRKSSSLKKMKKRDVGLYTFLTWYMDSS